MLAEGNQRDGTSVSFVKPFLNDLLVELSVPYDIIEVNVISHEKASHNLCIMIYQLI